MIHYPNILNSLFNKLQKYGAQPIIVGGYIRDTLLGIASKDIDIEVYHVSSFKILEELLQEFGSVNSVGKSFGVCKLTLDEIELDFTLPRIDNKVASGHQGFIIEIQSNLDFSCAASRRDFTINAIGYDVITHKILDPFGGVEDLNNKILKAVNPKSFIEDPLRVLRAVQFCARYNLAIDKELFQLCKKMVEKNMLSELSKERIFQEIKKLLLKAFQPSIGFKLLKNIGGLKYFPELNNLNEYSWNITMITLDEMSKFKSSNNKTNIILMLAALCNSLQSQSIKKLINSLDNEKELLNKVLTLINNLPEINNILSNNIRDYLLYKLATKVNIEELLLLYQTIYFAKNKTHFCEAAKILSVKARELNILNHKIPPILRGKDILACGKSMGLTIKPSKEFSSILDIAYEAQMHGKFRSHEEAVIWFGEYLKKHFK